MKNESKMLFWLRVGVWSSIDTGKLLDLLQPSTAVSAHSVSSTPICTGLSAPEVDVSC